jgi:hypothetical protein
MRENAPERGRDYRRAPGSPAASGRLAGLRFAAAPKERGKHLTSAGEHPHPARIVLLDIDGRGMRNEGAEKLARWQPHATGVAERKACKS